MPRKPDAKIPTPDSVQVFFIWFSDAVRRALALRGRSHIRGQCLYEASQRLDSAVAWSFWHSIFAIDCLTYTVLRQLHALGLRTRSDVVLPSEGERKSPGDAEAVPYRKKDDRDAPKSRRS